jgi:hypothetical protein
LVYFRTIRTVFNHRRQPDDLIRIA